jgi:antitoxin YefM
MTIINFSEARASLKQVMDRAILDHQEVVITRRNGEAVVMVSMEDWDAIKETLYLTSTPNNAKRLRRSIDALNRGDGVEKDIDLS